MSGDHIPRNRKGQFIKGIGGNPAGRPIGARSRVSERVLKRLDLSADRILETLIEAAEGGNKQAAIYLMSVLIPRAKNPSANLEDFPAFDLSSGDGLAKAHANLIAATAAGALDSDTAHAISSLLAEQRRIQETAALEARLAKLEGGKVLDISEYEEIQQLPPKASEEE